MADLDPLVPAPSAARILGISRRTLGRRVAAGELRAVKARPDKRAPLFVAESELRRVLAEMVRVS